MTHAPASDPIADLWRQARAQVAGALAALRGPAGVACIVARAVYDVVKARLRLLESLVLKLLLIEAARMPLCERASPSSGPSRACAQKVASHRQEDSASPETWRVRFRPRIPPDRRRSRGPAIAHLRACPARPRSDALALARRFEALRRVLADPRRAAAALAARLRALGAAAHAVARRIALFVPRCKAQGPTHAAALVRAHDALSAWPAPDST
jgi:hypothetical protein